MKKKLKNNSFLIPSFLAGVTGLGYEKTIHSTNNDSSVQTSSFIDSKNIKKGDIIAFKKDKICKWAI